MASDTEQFRAFLAWWDADGETETDGRFAPGTHADIAWTAWRAALAQQAEPVAWIQPDHLQKARVAPFLCRVEPTKRCADFVPLYAAPPDHREAMRMALREADEVVAALRALHRTTMSYEDACVLCGAEMVAYALRVALEGAR